MARASLYLSQDQHGTYHFRARVPANLRQHFNNKSEIKRSLKTDSRKEAVKLARAYRVEMDKKIAQLEKGTYYAETRTVEGEKLITHDDGTTEVIMHRTTRNGPMSEEAASLLRSEIRGELRAEAAHKIEQKRDAELHKAKLASIANTAPAAPQTNSGPLLSEAINSYVQEKTGLDHWKGLTASQNETTLRDFLEIVGDKPIKEITRQTITDFATKFGKLPANRNKKPEFKGKAIADILKMKGYEPIDSGTLRNNLIRVSSFFKWATANRLTEANPADNATQILPKKARLKNKIDARDPFTIEDLQKLFQADEFKSPKAPYQYWIPIIALYSGARLEEICKLRLEDVKQDGGIWYFDITNAKTEAGKRHTPIHNKIIELGLLDYVEQLKAKGQDRLFPELKPNKNGEYGAKVTKWFARYCDRCGVNDGKKVFHSFRHTVVDCLKQRLDVPHAAIHAIVGHEDKLAHGTYGKRYQAASLKPFVEQIKFDVDFSKLEFL